MKKTISLVMALMIVAFTFDVSAQSSRLVGEWDADGAQLFGKLSELGDIDIEFTFCADGTGVVEVEVDMQESMDDTTMMFFEMELNLFNKWQLSGNQLSVEIVDVKAVLKDLSFRPSSPELEAYTPMIRAMIEEQFSSDEFANSIIEKESISGSCTVEFVSDSIVNLISDDDTCRLTRK